MTWNSWKDCSACLLIWNCETLWNTAWISRVQTRCAAACPVCLCYVCLRDQKVAGFEPRSQGHSLKSIVPSEEVVCGISRIQSFHIIQLYRSSMDCACSLVRLCARLWCQNSLWSLPDTGGNAFYVTYAKPRFVSLPHSNHKELAPHLGSLSSIANFRSFGSFCTTNPQLGHPVMSNAPGQQSGYLQ